MCILSQVTPKQIKEMLLGETGKGVGEREGEGRSRVRAQLSYPTVELWSRNCSSVFVLTQARFLGSRSQVRYWLRREELGTPRHFSSVGPRQT